MKLKILHLSDLHIETGNVGTFYKDLADYLVGRFANNQPDFLIISGDIGDKCDNDNVKAAENWLIDLFTKLKLKKDQVLLCAGNHDLDTYYVGTDHSDKRMDYQIGFDYLSFKKNKYPKGAFKKFENIRSQISNTTVNLIGDNEFVIDIKDKGVRFFVLNSSNLSSIKKDKKIIFSNDLNNLPKDEKYGYIRNAFNDILCARKPDDYSNFDKNVFSPSLTYSENSTQQIDTEVYNFLVANNIAKDDNYLNILLLHHPEFCLHFLDRHPLLKIDESGSYANLASKSDFAICGHVHPNVTFTNDDKHLILRHLIGGKCNPNVKVDSPIFYQYEIENEKSKNGKINCLRTSFKFNESKGKYLFKTGNPKPIPLESNSIKNGTNLVNRAKVSDEKQFDLIIKRFSKNFVNALMSFFKANGFETQLSETDQWFPDNVALDYNFLINTRVNRIKIADNIYVYVDIFPSTLLSFPNYLQCRVETNMGNINNDAKHTNYYLPIIVDILCSAMDDEALCQAHRERIIKTSSEFFTKPYRLVKSIEVFLAKYFPDYDKNQQLAETLKIKECVFLDSSLVDSLISKDILDFNSLFYDFSHLLLTIKKVSNFGM